MYPPASIMHYAGEACWKASAVRSRNWKLKLNRCCQPIRLNRCCQPIKVMDLADLPLCMDLEKVVLAGAVVLLQGTKHSCWTILHKSGPRHSKEDDSTRCPRISRYHIALQLLPLFEGFAVFQKMAGSDHLWRSVVGSMTSQLINGNLRTCRSDCRRECWAVVLHASMHMNGQVAEDCIISHKLHARKRISAC